MTTQQTKSSKPRKPKASKTPKSTQPISKEEAVNYKGEDIRLMTAEAAYYHAERRGFQGGDIDEDWYLAEAEIEAKLSDDKPH